MDKYCGNCGNQLGPGDRFCESCGSPVEGFEAKDKTKLGLEISKQVANGKSKKIVILAGSGILALLVLIFAFNIVENYIGYKGTVHKMVVSLKEDDLVALESLASKVSEESYSAETGGYLEAYKSMVDEVLDKYDEDVGDIESIKYEIMDETELSQRKLGKFKELLIRELNMDVSQIKEVVSLEITLIVKGSEDTKNYIVDDLILIKEGGDWKIFYSPYGMDYYGL